MLIAVHQEFMIVCSMLLTKVKVI